MELTDYANMALSIPSANTNIWNLEQDTVGTRLTNSRHGLADNGGAWVSYFGGNFNGDNGTINLPSDSYLLEFPRYSFLTGVASYVVVAAIVAAYLGVLRAQVVERFA